MYNQIDNGGKFLRKCGTIRQMTQSELAERVHMSRSSIGRIERGKYNNGVSISTLLDIAEGLGTDLSALVTFSEEEERICFEGQ